MKWKVVQRSEIKNKSGTIIRITPREKYNIVLFNNGDRVQSDKKLTLAVGQELKYNIVNKVFRNEKGEQFTVSELKLVNTGIGKLDVTRKYPLDKIVLVDIFPVAIRQSYSAEDDIYKLAWEYHCKSWNVENMDEEWMYRASHKIEFSKIRFASLTVFKNGKPNTKIFSGDDVITQTDFVKKLYKAFDADYIPASWDYNGYVYPFLYRNIIKNDIELHNNLDVSDKKPWEIEAIDIKVLYNMHNRPAMFPVFCLYMGVDVPQELMQDNYTIYYDYPEKAEEIYRKKIDMLIQLLNKLY